VISFKPRHELQRMPGVFHESGILPKCANIFAQIRWGLCPNSTDDIHQKENARQMTTGGFSNREKKHMCSPSTTTQGTDCAIENTACQVPIAYAVARLGRDGIWSWIVKTCPLCHGRHAHGGGSDDEPGLLGVRAAHCAAVGAGSYRLVEVQQ